MKKQLYSAVCGLLTVIAASSVGCSAGFKSFTGSSSSDGAAQSATPAGGGDDQVTKSQTAALDGQQAIDNALTALTSLTNASGAIDLSVFQGTGTNQGALAPLVAKLKPVFDEAYTKVVAVKTQFDTSKATLTSEIAKLSPTDPTAVSLTAQLAKINDLEAQFEAQVRALAAKLTAINTLIDQLVAQATAYIPIPGLSTIAGFLIDSFIVNDVKALITDLQTKLMAL